MKRLFLLAFGLIGSSWLGAGAAPPPPNIVYILGDDLGRGDLGCYGQTKIRTPNIDRLAAEGMKFQQHYSGSTVCAPSRCTLMTGLHTGHAFVRSNREVGTGFYNGPEGQLPIPRDTVTLAKLLKARGYSTGAFGKWGLGGPGSDGHPNLQGFDYFYGYLCQKKAHTYYPD
jgi:arylsulfatase A